jgi:hypothetical protein
MSAKPKRSEENKPSHKHPRKKRQRQEHDLANHYGATLMRAVLLSTIAAVLRRISQSSEDDGAKIRTAPIRVCPRASAGKRFGGCNRGDGCKAEDFNTPAGGFPAQSFIRPCGLGAARLPRSGSCPDRLSDFETGENMND